MNAHECSICLERTKRRQHTRELACGHRFHGRCVAAWFRRGSLTCPLCRAPAFGRSAPLSVRVAAYFQYNLPRMLLPGLAHCLRYIVSSVGFMQDVGVTTSELSLLQFTAYTTTSLREFLQTIRRHEALVAATATTGA